MLPIMASGLPGNLVEAYLAAVSYTHLDVYKRQVVLSSVNVKIIKLVGGRHLSSHIAAKRIKFSDFQG